VGATITLPRRFCGPDDAANGGYTAGRLARLVGGTVEATLRRPAPLDRPLTVDREPERVVLRDDEELIAEATASALDLDPIPPIDLEDADAASRASPYRDPATHPFPRCFVCGPARRAGDGLRLFAGRVPGTEHFATTWVPETADDVLVWAALDCPSSGVLQLIGENPPPHVLGRMTAQIDRRPEPGRPHVIMSWLFD